MIGRFLLTIFLLTIFFLLVALTFKAWLDAYREKKGIWTPHSKEWWILSGFVTVMSIIVLGSHFTKFNWLYIREVCADLAILVGIAWIYFDFIKNIFSGDPLDHLGNAGPHQALTDKFIIFVGAEEQYLIKITFLAVMVIFATLIIFIL